MATINDLKCVITFWKDDIKAFRIEGNFLADLWGMLHSWLNENDFYTKATVEWQGKIYVVDRDPTNGPSPRVHTPV